MLIYGALSGPLPKVGIVVAAALAAVAMLHRNARVQAVAMLGALVLAPVLLLGDIWHSPQLAVVHRHPLVAVVGALIALAAVAAAALLVAKHPEVLAGAVIVALPFRIPIESGGVTSNLLVPLYFVVAAGAVAFIVTALRGRAPPEPAASDGNARLPAPATPVPPRDGPVRWLEWLLAGYVVLYALQAAYSPKFTTALQQVVFFYVPFALAYCLLRRLDWTQRLTRACLALLAGLAVLFALVGFVEYETKTIFLNPKLIAANQLHAYFTVNSVFFDPNIFGRFLALVMILLASVILYARRQRTVLVTGAVLAILWVALLLTLSRSSIGALLVGLGALAAIRWRVGRAVFIAAGVVALAVAVIAITPTTFGLNQGLNGASSGRPGLVTGGLDLFKQRPLWGYGSGSFETEFAARHHEIGETTSASHTIPITIAAEQGLIGELVYLGLVLAALFVLFRRCRSDPARVAIAAAFLALLFHTLLYADFLEDPITWTLLAIGSALAARPAADSGGRGSQLAAGDRELQQQLA
ncbi:MAG TPA: O-antigen ligase family protein [Solirubrobacteraceae bacterium]|nr:O-antigen ligase family protein [Solirubrobacteraceae bacterium]